MRKAGALIREQRQRGADSSHSGWSRSSSGVEPALSSGVEPALSSGVEPALSSGAEPALSSRVAPPP
jgi:hypothetical protein